MKWGFIFIIVLWSFSGYGGLLSFFGNRVKQACSKGFLGGKSRVVNIEENQKAKEVSFPFFLLVVRHASYHGTHDVGGEIARGQAEAHGLSDVRLRLSEEGKEKFMEMCKARNFCSFDLLIHSNSMRAWETANIFSEHFTIRKRRASAHLTEFRAEPENILQEIKNSKANAVVLVGHQPFLIKFLSKALGEEKGMLAHILLDSYGSMVPLKFSSWEFGAAELHF